VKNKKGQMVCDRCEKWHQRYVVVINSGKKQLHCLDCIAELTIGRFRGDSFLLRVKFALGELLGKE